MIAVFAYALVLPAGAVPCVHHAAEMASAKAQSAMAHAAPAKRHAAQTAQAGCAPGDVDAAGSAGDADRTLEHLSHALGCDCCIGGMCAGACAGGCSLPTACCAVLATDSAAVGPDVSACDIRAAADARADLSAPMVRPQAPRAPPAI